MNFSSGQCSSGPTQSRPFPARAVKRVESAAYITNQDTSARLRLTGRDSKSRRLPAKAGSRTFSSGTNRTPSGVSGRRGNACLTRLAGCLSCESLRAEVELNPVKRKVVPEVIFRRSVEGGEPSGRGVATFEASTGSAEAHPSDLDSFGPNLSPVPVLAGVRRPADAEYEHEAQESNEVTQPNAAIYESLGWPWRTLAAGDFNFDGRQGMDPSKRRCVKAGAVKFQGCGRTPRCLLPSIHFMTQESNVTPPLLVSGVQLHSLRRSWGRTNLGQFPL